MIQVSYNHFGELLKEIRIMNKMTLEQLSDKICSTRQLSRIESGENNPSLYIIHNISKKLNIDLQEYYRIYFCSGSFIVYDFKSKFEQLLENANILGLKELINTIEKMDEFLTGENRQYVLYGKALCSAYLDKNYIISNNYCLEGIQIEDHSFQLDIEIIENRLYSNVGLTMINLIGGNYNRIGEKDKAFNLSEKLFLLLEYHIFQTPYIMYRKLDFEKRLYQSSCYNLSILHMKKCLYDKSLEYINKGISLSTNENYMFYLPELLAQKSRLLYKMGSHDESYKLFTDCLSFYRICRDEESTEKIEKEIENTFNSLKPNKTANLKP